MTIIILITKLKLSILTILINIYAHIIRCMQYIIYSISIYSI